MKKPGMILFDYGETLCNEEQNGPLRGNEALLTHATHNPHGHDARSVQAMADKLSRDIAQNNAESIAEVTTAAFNRYLYEYLDIGFALSPTQMEEVFWDGAYPAQAAPGIEDALAYLKNAGIRTGVISNLAHHEDILRRRIDRLLPGHQFEFIMATSAYVFRKPHPNIFMLAQKKSGLAVEKLWYCGDRANADLKGASQAGMFPVWYQPKVEKGEEAPYGALHIHHWDELSAFIDTLEDA